MILPRPIPFDDRPRDDIVVVDRDLLSFHRGRSGLRSLTLSFWEGWGIEIKVTLIKN